MTIENISCSVSTKKCCPTWQGSHLQPPDLQLEMHLTEPKINPTIVVFVIFLSPVQEIGNHTYVSASGNYVELQM